jgi:dTDP-4-amino-4,6-dideoxygalactose transaminase
MYATTAIRAIGATPVFADIDDASMLMSPRSVEAHIAGCDAVVVTHLFGRLAPVGDICRIADAHRVAVIEDCAQAHGARRNGKTAGAFGAAGCFSFYPTKNLGALGDGGAIVTDDAELAASLRKLRQYGWSSKYRAEMAGGRNSRLDEMQAAALRAKLPHLDAWNERRREIARRYRAGITHPAVRLPGEIDEANVAHLFVVRTQERDSLAAHLKRRGVPVDIHYPVPDFMQPALASVCGPVHAPVTEAACRTVLTLPCFPALRDAEVDAICAAVNDWAPGR